MTFVAPDGSEKVVDGPKTTNYGSAKRQALDAMQTVFPHCSSKCIEAQLDAYHNQEGITDETVCKQIVTGRHGPEAVQEANAIQATLGAVK